MTCGAVVAAPSPALKEAGGCSWGPSAAVLGAVMLYPLGYAIYLSLFNYDLGSGSRDFIGFGNYAALLADDRFWHTLNRTVAIVSAAVGLEFCLGLLVAYGLYRLTFAVARLILRGAWRKIATAFRLPIWTAATRMLK